MFITANVLSVFRKRKKGFPEDARAWLQIISSEEDASLIGKKILLIYGRNLPPSIRKKVLVRVRGELTEAKHRPAIEIGDDGIIPDFTASSLEALIKLGVDISGKKEIMKEKGTVRLFDVLEEIIDTEAEENAYITELCSLQYLFDEAELGMDIDMTAEIYDTLRHRAAHCKQAIKDFVEENPWVISQVGGIPFVAGQRLATHLGIDMGKQAVYAYASAIAWNTARGGNSYIPFRFLYKRTEDIRMKVGIDTPKKFRELLFKGEKAFGGSYGRVSLCSSYRGSVVAERSNFYGDDEKWKAEYDVEAVYPISVYFSEKNAAKEMAGHILKGVKDLNNRITVDDQLDTYQKQAIHTALKCPVTVWIGHAGSGKTRALKALAKAAKDEGIPVTILAPTAVAADRAGAGLGIQASTIHRYAGVTVEEDDLLMDSSQKSLRAAMLEIPASELPDITETNIRMENIVLVDEVSMCDITAFAHLMHVIIPGTHLVLIGDPAQLPAVGPSGFFQQLVCNCPVPVCELEGNHRSGDTICSFANSIRKGYFAPTGSEQLKQMPGEREEAIQYVAELKEKGVSLEDIFVLAPRRENTRILNTELQKLWNPEGKEIEGTGFKVGDPVICIRNDYAGGRKARHLRSIRHKGRFDDVFNGYRGKIIKEDEDGFFVKYKTPNGDRELPYSQREAVHWLLPGYAMTVHKAQGGEVKHVITVFPEKMNRAMLYTAATRAKKELVMIGDKNAYADACGKNPLPPRTKFLQRFVWEAGSSCPQQEDPDVIVI